jgi:hypothetical protein
MYESPSINKELNPNTPYDRGDLRDYTIILGHRRGVAPAVDFGFQVAFIGTAKFDGKYMFYQNGGFAAATGFGLGYSHLQTGEGQYESQMQIIDYIIPFYTSYSLGSVTIYLTPQQVIRDISGDVGGGMSLFGYSIGLMGGDEYRMAFEYTQMQSGVTNIAMGYYFD